MIDKLLDGKGIIGMIAFVLLVVVPYISLSELQDTDLGRNEYANKSLEEGKSSIRILTNGYFIAGAISGVIAFVILFITLYKRFTE